MMQKAASGPAVVRNIDIHAGLYRVQSSGDPNRWYLVDVRQGTCSCKCGQSGFRNAKLGFCRHLAAARVVAKGWHDMRVARRTGALTQPFK